MTPPQLEESIERGFDKVRYPGDDRLTERSCSECGYPLRGLVGIQISVFDVDAATAFSAAGRRL